MIVGVPKEIKAQERRVGLTPAGAAALVRAGHEVLVERGAGGGAGLADDRYAAAGAQIVAAPAALWSGSDLVVKVKEPLEDEFPYLRADLTLFTYLHLAAAPALVEALVRSGCTAIAYENVALGGALPLLVPMSEIAGRLAAQAAAYFLQEPLGGRGVLMGGAPGVAPAHVLVIGGGVVGANAARVAAGMGASVTIVDRSANRARALEESFAGRATVLIADADEIATMLPSVDAVIGAVLVPGSRAPHVVTREMLDLLPPASVLVDVAIDQGGCFETSRATTHAAPAYEAHGRLHYCVANMPGAVPVTATRALTNATFPYVALLAGGTPGALDAAPELRAGLAVRDGEVVDPVLQGLMVPAC